MSGKDDIIDKIIVARVGLLLRHPFFGNMATRLKIQEVEWLPTAATDGRALYFNREFFSDLTTKEIEFVVAHEILHVIFDHMSRKEGRDPQIWNIAADYCVNGTLTKDRIGVMPAKVKGFHDTKYYGWGAESVYDDIYEKFDEEELKALGELLDEHMEWDKQDPNNPNRPVHSKEELKKIRDEIKEAMIQAANAAGAGNVPAGIQRMIKEMTESKMNWRELLRQQIQSTIKDDYTWMRPSRKGWHTGAVLPGMNFAQTIDIAVSLDMSGSIGDDQAQDFISEIKGIMDEFKDYKVKIWCFDTKVYNEQDFTSESGVDISEYEIMGGGGTDFMCNWEYMKDQGIEPKKFIMFTDGYPWDSWGDESYCETVFIIHGNKEIVPPFGTHAYYEK